ncbi:MAG TPA: aryl-sulfate sulfotransferase [Candidatus Acidoferrales bacterium]|nr:aryl-sulfate sulfotransferase [Candidatus Acidoferrales bacterium]
MPPVEQVKAKRAGIGLRACDVDRAFPGFTLFAPQSGGGIVYLIDLNGNVVHSWRMPYAPGNYGYLTERGTLFYNAKIVEEAKRFISHQPWKGGAVLESDWSGRVLWEVRQPDHHHDGIRLRNGNVLLICLEPLPPDIVARVIGGMPGTEHNGEMYADYLVEMTISGNLVWEWHAWENLDPDTDSITAVQERREEWTHANGVAELPNGDIVVSFRVISTVVIIDRKTGKISWKLGAPPLSGQHAPAPLANGNLLLFDNGPHRLDHPMPFSRVIEVDLKSKQIVWKYQERRESDFFSPRISNAQRLPNGNTLICEGDFGRIFEVTLDGELVWEYVNPYFGAGPTGPNNRVFRAYRYSVEEIAKAQQYGKEHGAGSRE